MKEWVARLEKLGETREDVPGLRLLGFFEGMAEGEEENKKFETKKTQGVSTALRECGPFCGEWLRGNVGVWREIGFLK